MSYTTRLLGTLFILFLSLNSFSQNGYYKYTIVNGDTTAKTMKDQVYWNLKQDYTDYIIESTLNSSGKKIDSKYPVVSRTYEGYIKEYVVSPLNDDDFTIRFHTGDNTVTYIYPNKTIIYKGRHIKFYL
ncbi:MAG: hypothetical protein HRT57_01965 [Crocinitomicaceae bacterium]|nr:hypothetical protein [Crocinitomicaceae bacterium]